MSPAILQFEIDRAAADSTLAYNGQVDRWRRLRALLADALFDTLRNGGTFTVVATDKTITAVQLADPVGLDDEVTS